jgi:glyoxalase family protein
VSKVGGIHHVTCIAGDPRENLAFYTGVLGMRLVKRSVNQDAPDTYHLFYADAAGNPGTDLTFFPWPQMPAWRKGTGLTVEVDLAVPVSTLGHWRRRLQEHGVEPESEEERFGERALSFRDPHGLHLALVGVEERSFAPWDASPVGEEEQVRGLHSVRLWVRDSAKTKELLCGPMGLVARGRDQGWERFESGDGGSGTILDLMECPQESRGERGQGAVHHVAWRLPDSDSEMELRELLARAGHRPTPQIDRFWFQSVYFVEPGGVLFELATDGPGFALDEEPEHLGEALILPPWLESERREIEAGLGPLE